MPTKQAESQRKARVGLLLNEEDSEKIVFLAEYCECDVYSLVASALDTLMDVVESEYENE